MKTSPGKPIGNIKPNTNNNTTLDYLYNKIIQLSSTLRINSNEYIEYYQTKYKTYNKRNK